MPAAIAKSVAGINPAQENAHVAFDSVTEILGILKKIPGFFNIVQESDLSALYAAIEIRCEPKRCIYSMVLVNSNKTVQFWPVILKLRHVGNFAKFCWSMVANRNFQGCNASTDF